MVSAAKSLKGKHGADIVIYSAPWRDAKMLFMAVSREASRQGVNFDDPANSFFSLFFRLCGSIEVDSALAICLQRCTYNNEKITDETFNSIEAREDFHQVVKECAMVNLGPLGKELYSEFEALFAKKKNPSAGQK